jgi:TonB family protein
MGYQALLFCPDEKLARVVSQVFSELDFSVEPVHEPFAAVKKLMAQRYDAVVVDCESEQNASLLFKSARNSSSNQSSLAIALVEGQAGVAKAYRIGANLVLTKPINVEQTKGTLRVARGLLRKNSDAAGTTTGSVTAPAVPTRTTPVSAGSSLQPASRSAAPIAPSSGSPEFFETESPLTETIPAEFPIGAAATTATAVVSEIVEEKPAAFPTPAAQSQIVIAAEPAAEALQTDSLSAGKIDAHKIDAQKNETAKIVPASTPIQNPSHAFRSVAGSAAAPAPAREVTAPPAELEHANPSPASAPIPIPTPVPAFSSASASGAPSFAVLGEEESAGTGGNKKILIVAAAVLALAVLGYLGYENFGKSSSATPTPQPASASQNSGEPAPAPRSISSPAAPSSTATYNRTNSANQGPALTPAPKTASPIAPDKLSAGAGNSSVIRIAADAGPATKKQDAAPLHVKSTPAATSTEAQSDESAPPPASTLAASVNDNRLSGVMSSAATNLPKPTLATLRISQGVSQGLLIKRVQPTYPRAALAVHTQGAVQIEATINKEGNVTNLKVLGGDPVLAQAALGAVRQWRYKPYYLDGEPVEIQTTITVNFKAN